MGPWISVERWCPLLVDPAKSAGQITMAAQEAVPRCPPGDERRCHLRETVRFAVPTGEEEGQRLVRQALDINERSPGPASAASAASMSDAVRMVNVPGGATSR